MNNRIIPVTLALVDKEENKRLERIIASNYMVRLMDEDADEMGVLIYEPGPSVDEDMPHIIRALETGQAEDVFLAGHGADPDLLIRAMRSGIREFLQFPVSEDDFRAAIMRTAMRSSLEEDDGEKGKIISVLGAKGGMGVTSVAVNLAWTLNKMAPGRTVLFDLRRPAGETHYFLDLKYEYDWGHLVKDITRLDATYLKSVISEHESGLHVLPGPAGEDRPDPQSLLLILEQLRSNYDHVVVDTGYAGVNDLPKEIELSDTLLTCLHLSLPCLARTARLMESMRSHDPDADRRTMLVATRVIKDSSIGVAEAAEVLHKEIPWTIPEDYSSALSSINQGTPLVEAYPKSPATKVFLDMGKKLGPQKKDGKKGFSWPFASLFRKKSVAKGKDKTIAGAVS